MFDLILKAVVYGFILSVMIGPVFFVLLETSIRRGIRAGLAFDLGVLFSDLIYIAFAYLFYAEVSSFAEGQSRETAKLIGGIIFIVYGVFSFFKKPKMEHVSGVKAGNQSNWSEYAKLTLKGFLLNFANPLVIFYWFGILTFAGSSVTNANGEETGSIFFFIAVLLFTFFSIDILKILGAKQLRPFITNRLMKGLNQLIGIVFIVFGILLIANPNL